MDEKVVSTVVQEIEDRFGKMVVTRGESHNFVGMNAIFKDNDTVEVMMKDYITEYFEVYGEPINKSANTPAKHKLFVSEVSTPLDEEKKETFNHIVVELLYVPKRECVDIDLAMSYL